MALGSKANKKKKRIIAIHNIRSISLIRSVVYPLKFMCKLLLKTAIKSVKWLKREITLGKIT